MKTQMMEQLKKAAKEHLADVGAFKERNEPAPYLKATVLRRMLHEGVAVAPAMKAIRAVLKEHAQPVPEPNVEFIPQPMVPVRFKDGEAIDGCVITPSSNGAGLYYAEKADARIYFRTRAGEGKTGWEISYVKKNGTFYRAERYTKKYVPVVEALHNELLKRWKEANGQ